MIRRAFIRCLPLLLLLAVFCADVSLVHACPGCKEALASEDPTQAGLVRGFFWSILFMMGMPFLLFSAFGTYMYLEVRKARAAQQATAEEPARSFDPVQENAEQPVEV